jgi:hypothetical protein
MNTRILILSVFCPVLIGPARAQLHFISGYLSADSSEGTYASGLFRVESDGKVTSISELVPKKTGTERIELSYDSRVAVVRPWRGSSIIVLSFDDPVGRTCKLPALPPARSPAADWVAYSPSRGLAFEILSVPARDQSVGDSVVHAISLDPSLPCESKWTNLDSTEIRYAVLAGRAGTTALPIRTVAGGVDRHGAVNLWAGALVPLGYPSPSALLRGFEPIHSAVGVIDSHVFVVSSFDKDNNYRVMVYRKSDKSWRLLPIRTELKPGLRGFGRYLVATERRPRSSVNSESPGGAEWREEESTMGPSTALAFRSDEVLYPGKLHIYDVDTDNVFQIDTKQGDSEILLIEGNTVYYRLSDRIYSAPITENGIGAARLLARDEAIRDAHWAFYKH